MRFKILRSCNSVFDLIKTEAIYICFNKPRSSVSRNNLVIHYPCLVNSVYF